MALSLPRQVVFYHLLCLVGIYQKKNLIFATGLQGDHNNLAVTDEDEIGLLTGQVRGKLVYNGGMGYYNSEEIVWLLTTA